MSFGTNKCQNNFIIIIVSETMKFTDLTQRALKDLTRRSTAREEKLKKVRTDFNQLQDQIEENNTFMQSRLFKVCRTPGQAPNLSGFQGRHILDFIQIGKNPSTAQKTKKKKKKKNADD